MRIEKFFTCFIFITVLSFMLTNCKTRSNSEQTETKFAVQDSYFTGAGIAAHLEMIKQDIPTDFTKYVVCVEGSSEDLTEAQFLFEIKLAYLTWLKASNHFTETDWSNLIFLSKNDCQNQNLKITSIVSAIDLAEYTSFQVSCSRDLEGCQSEDFTLGEGRPGLNMYNFTDTATLSWDSLTLAIPAKFTLNPKVKWENIATNIVQHSQYSESIKNQIQQQYTLLSEKKDVTYQELVSFASLLEDNKISGVSNIDAEFENILKVFPESGESEKTYEIIAKYSSFKTILHEIGHQFGIDHAHEPNANSITGNINGIVSDGNDGRDQFTTDEAVMAYGKSYFYLTEDDKLAIRHLIQQNLEFLKKKRLK